MKLSFVNWSKNLAKKSKPGKHKLETWCIMGAGFSIAAVVHIFVAEVRFIPSLSMKPTMEKRDRVILDKLHYRSHLPQRQEIVVFNPPEELLKLNIHDSLIKRIVGLPGEQVQITGGQVYINGSPLKEDYIAEPPRYNWGPQVIPPNSYLVLGDNRNQSFDSHSWGFLPRQRIIGRASVRFWPLHKIKLF
jgi:signal peptidase I